MSLLAVTIRFAAGFFACGSAASAMRPVQVQLPSYPGMGAQGTTSPATRRPAAGSPPASRSSRPCGPERRRAGSSRCSPFTSAKTKFCAPTSKVFTASKASSTDFAWFSWKKASSSLVGLLPGPARRVVGATRRRRRRDRSSGTRMMGGLGVTGVPPRTL